MNDDFQKLTERVAPGATLMRTWPLKGGVAAYVHGLELAWPDGRREQLVVRRHGALAKGHRPEVAADEFRLLGRLHELGLPVAEPRWLDAHGEIFGSPCLVLGFVEGSMDLPADAVVQMAAMLASLHALDVEALGVGFLPRRIDPADEGLEGQAAELAAGLTAGLVEGLPARRTPLLRQSLLHGDFWPGNLLWRGGQIAAVLDWEDAAVGDPHSDVAACRQELLWRLGEEAMETFTQAYEAKARVDRWQLAVWEVFVATAALQSMAQWGLPPAQEAEMRRRSEGFIERARRSLA